MTRCGWTERLSSGKEKEEEKKEMVNFYRIVALTFRPVFIGF
jgi:hypothetical protein